MTDLLTSRLSHFIVAKVQNSQNAFTCSKYFTKAIIFYKESNIYAPFCDHGTLRFKAQFQWGTCTTIYTTQPLCNLTYYNCWWKPAIYFHYTIALKTLPT